MKSYARQLAFVAVILGAACSIPKITELTCADGQLLVSKGGMWTCQALPSAATGPSGPPGLAPSCSAGQVAVAIESGWGCLTLPSAAVAAPPPACATGSVSRWDGARWQCDVLSAEAYLCPAGYTSSAVAEAHWNGTVCVKVLASGQVDEMVRVGDFWIDRFEMSGSTPPIGLCGPNTDGSAPGYTTGATGPVTAMTTASACSVRGVQPAGGVTWFQAAQMCANAGKELCSNKQWQTAVNGTPDPGNGVTIPYSGLVADACNVTSNAGEGANAGASGAPANTSAHQDCVSAYGAYDMIGNLEEWTGDWSEGGSEAGFTQGLVSNPWPNGYGDNGDATFNLNGSASAIGSGSFVAGAPAATVRGGAWGQGSSAGAFSFSLNAAPSYWDMHLGARCCYRGR